MRRLRQLLVLLLTVPLVMLVVTTAGLVLALRAALELGRSEP
jgi:hypothetical protein